MKYIKEFNNHNAYATFLSSSNYITPNVSLCIVEDEVHYNPYVPKAALDILYSDANGNLSVDSNVLPASEGKTPIGLCVAGTGFFGVNEPARFMSLKYMNYTTPETGSTTNQDMYWGNYGTDIPTIDNIMTTYLTTYGGGPEHGYMNVDYYDNSSQTYKIPNPITVNNEWNLSELGTVNAYATTDIDGKNKTDKILATATAQSTWRTDTSIINASDAGYAPAACCCARYHTLGTQAGDWYLGACGEMCMILAKKTDINAKLAAINAIYPNDCISVLFNSINNNPSRHWSSTEYSNWFPYYVNASNGSVDYDKKSNGYNVLAMFTF